MIVSLTTSRDISALQASSKRIAKNRRMSVTQARMFVLNVYWTLLVLSVSAVFAAPTTHFVCPADNELYDLVVKAPAVQRHDTVDAALQAGQKGDALLVLAPSYPANLTAVTPAQYNAAATKGLKLFVEFPASLPPGSSFNLTAQFGATAVPLDKAVGVAHVGMQSTISRLVAVSNRTGLQERQILAAHGAVVLPVLAPNTAGSTPPDLFLAAARVAGYQTAIFGLPVGSLPVLFSPTGHTLVATLRISNLIQARYGPLAAWTQLLRFVLDWLGAAGVELPTLVPAVRPRYVANATLPANAEALAVAAAVNHLTNSSRLLYSASTDPPHPTGDAPEALPCGPRARGAPVSCHLHRRGLLLHH